MTLSRKIFEFLEKIGAKGTEITPVTAPSDTPNIPDETREYLLIHSDYMVSMPGKMDNKSGIKFEMVREDLGIVVRLIEVDVQNMIALRDTLDKVISEENKDMMFG